MKAMSVSELLDTWRKTWPRIVARTWSDAAFKARLLADPEAVAREYGLPMLPGLNTRICEGEEAPTLTLTLPPRPAELGDPKAEEIETLVAQGTVAKSGVATSCCF